MTARVGTVHLAFGSNIGPEANLVRALNAVARIAPVTAVSAVYRSAPVDADGSDFLNAVAAVEWPCGSTELADLKERLTAVEVAQGCRAEPERPEGRSARWPARAIDLDIVLAGDLVARYGARPWQVPHPDIVRFAHVAVPLAGLVPAPHPATGRALDDIAAELAAAADLRRVALAGWGGR